MSNKSAFGILFVDKAILLFLSGSFSASDNARWRRLHVASYRLSFKEG